MLPLLVALSGISAGPVPTIANFAGTGTLGYAGDGGPADKALLNNPFDVTFDTAGNLYFSDTNNHVVRRVDSKTGIITTVAGSGKKGFRGDDGPATAAELNEPYGIKLDAEGNLYIVDRLNFCVRAVESKTGTIRRLAGTSTATSSPDGGPAQNSALVEPNGIALDGKGTLFITDVRDQRVRTVDLKSGTIGTLAGAAAKKVTGGDGGPIASATFAGPRAVAVHPNGSILIVEREGNCVRKLDRTANRVSRFAGTGKKGFTGDGGPAISATFDGPKELCIAPTGDVYIVDTENEAIRRIDAKTGVITTVAGKGRTKTPGQGNGGPATAATLGRPHGVAIGSDGAIYIGDTLSQAIRVVK